MSKIDPDKLLEFLNKYDLDFKDRGQSYVLECPSCKEYKLYINKQEGFYTCFKCADDGYRSSSPFKILSELTGLSQQAVNSFFYNFASDAFLLEDEAKRPKQEIKNAFVDTKNHYKINLSVSEPGLNYLAFRGINKDLAQKMQIKYDPIHKQVIFPIFDLLDQGRLVGFQGRSIDRSVPKQYSKYTMPGFKKAHYLMFEETINSQSVIIAEGPISALKFARCGIGYVATMGKIVSDTQFGRLDLLGVTDVYLALDSDAYKETHSLIKKYCDKYNLYMIDVPQGREDFGDSTFEECREEFLKAQRANLMTILPEFV